MNRLQLKLALIALIVTLACVPSRPAAAADASGGGFTVGGVAVPICRIGNAEGPTKQLAGVGSPAGRCGRAVNGALASVVDAISKSDCSVGNGAVVTTCQYDAAQSGSNKWVPAIGAGSGDQVAINGQATVDPSFNDSAKITFSAAANVVTATVAANAISLGADTTGAYVAGATTGGGLAMTGSEGGTLGLLACSSGEVLKSDGSAWSCGSAGGNSFLLISPSSGSVVAADSVSDTLTITGGAGITVTGNSTTDTLTIDSTLGATVGPSELQAADFGSFSCNGATCSLDASSVTDSAIGSGVSAAKISAGVVSNAEFDRLDGVTSAIQAQIDAKLPLAGGTMSGQINMGAAKITNLAAGSTASDAARFDQVPDATTLIKRDGSQAWSANQSVGGYKLTSLGAPTAGSADAARHADLPFSCGSTANSCAKVDDTNADGDIAPELQAAINSVLWPGGTLTTAKDVYLVAPRQGTYNLASRIIICGDTSPPSGSTAPDCSGSTQQLPTVHFVGDWRDATLRCTMPNVDGGVVNGFTPCLKIGDAWADSGDFAHNVPLAMDSPLTIVVTQEAYSYAYGSLGFWCDGCTGELRLAPTNASGLFVFNLAVIAGPRLHSVVYAPDTSGYATGRSIVMDGSQAGSSIELRMENGTLEIGSGWATTNQGRWSPVDGCSYNGFVGECDDLKILPATVISGAPRTSGLIDVNAAQNVVIDGSYYMTSSAKPTIELLMNNANATFRNVVFRGLCSITASALNPCLRTIGTYAPAWTPQVLIDGRVVTGATSADLDKAGVGPINNTTGKTNIHFVVGPNATMLNTGGGNPNLLTGKNVWSRGLEMSDASAAVGESRTLRVASQTISSTPQCADLADGTWRACSDERTKLYKPAWTKGWTQRAAVRLYGAAAGTTACNIRVMKNGSDPAGDTNDYYPKGFAFTVGGDGLKASGDYLGRNVAEPFAPADYLQIQATDDYANVGGQEACLAPDYTGWASANGTTTTLVDTTQTFSGLSGKRVVLVAGNGALATKSISSSTSTQITVGSAFPIATYGSDNLYRTKYRVVAGSGSCACAGETLPAMDVSLDLFEMR